MNFHKYQGLGNDFVLVDGSKNANQVMPDPALIRAICDRRFGVGGDGMLVYDLLDAGSKVRMIYFNADGSRAETCFNGLRCIALHAVRVGDVATGKRFVIESDAGEVTALVLEQDSNEVIRTIMPPGEELVALMALSSHPQGDPPLTGAERDYRFAFGSLTGLELSLGNPHFISGVEDETIDGLSRDIRRIGGEVERAGHFPNGVNFELASLTVDGGVRMAVWERGVGPTLACGSGATAAVCAGIVTGRLMLDRRVMVEMAGGKLGITLQSGEDGNLAHLIVEGGAKHVFDGSI